MRSVLKTVHLFACIVLRCARSFFFSSYENHLKVREEQKEVVGGQIAQELKTFSVVLIVFLVTASVLLSSSIAIYFGLFGVQGIKEAPQQEAATVVRVEFQRSGGFAGLRETMIIEIIPQQAGVHHNDSSSSGDAWIVKYSSNKFGNSTSSLGRSQVANLTAKAGELQTNKTYWAKSGVADYFTYELTILRAGGNGTGSWNISSTTIRWVDAWACNETLPPSIASIQVDLETILQNARSLAMDVSGSESEVVSAFNTALSFVSEGPTFKFDGVSGTISSVNNLTLTTNPPQYIITLAFDSTHSGYGNRSEQVSAQVITHHTAEVTIVRGSLVSTVLDEVWDEVNQRANSS